MSAYYGCILELVRSLSSLTDSPTDVTLEIESATEEAWANKAQKHAALRRQESMS